MKETKKVLKKDELLDKIASASSLNKKQANEFLCAFKDVVTTSLKEGFEISVPDLGKFSTSFRSAREGINPKTKEKIKISAKTVAKFKPSKKLKESL